MTLEEVDKLLESNHVVQLHKNLKDHKKEGEKDLDTNNELYDSAIDFIKSTRKRLLLSSNKEVKSTKSTLIDKI